MEDSNATLPERVIESFGGLTKTANALGHRSVTTVDGWKRSGRIPSWRKREIEDAAQREGVTLPADFAGVIAA